MSTFSQTSGSPRMIPVPPVYRDRPVFEATEIADQFPTSEVEVEGFFDPDPVTGGDDGSGRTKSYEDIAGQSPYFDLGLT